MQSHDSSTEQVYSETSENFFSFVVGVSVSFMQQFWQTPSKMCFTVPVLQSRAGYVSKCVSVSRHVFECLGLAMPMSRLGLGP